MAEGGSKLSEGEIYECLKNLNVPVRMNELKCPTREFLVRVFECFLKDLQIDIASPEFRPWEATSHIEDGDIYEETLLLIILTMNVNYIINPCGVNITIKDIVEPKPKRTKKILNYLLVFWMYYLQRFARFCDIETTFEDEKKRAQDMIYENEALDEKYEHMLITLSNLQPPEEELASIVSAKEDKAAKFKAESEALQSDYQTLKKQEISLKEQINAVDLDTVKAQEKLEELSQLILSSPNQKRINSEIQNLQDKIKAKELEAKEYESKYKEDMKRLQLLEEYHSETKKIFTTLNEMDESYKQIKETVKTVVDSHQRIVEEEDKFKQLKMELERKEDWKYQQQQKCAQVVLNSRKQLEALHEVLNENLKEEAKLKRSVESLEASVKTAQAVIDHESDRILEIIEKSKEADAKCKERQKQFEYNMQKTGDQFKSHCDDVSEIIKKAFSSTS